MLNKLQNGWKTQLIFVALVLMMTTLFFSRALLSVSMMLFAAATFFHPFVKTQFKNFFASPLLWGISLLFFVPFISGLWSEDMGTWQKVVQVKLPFLILPLAFAGVWHLSARQWRYIIWIFLMLVLAGSVWSFGQYLADNDAIHEAYLKAKTIPVPLEGDHVRFSWMVCIAVIMAALMIEKKKNELSRIALIIIAIWLVVYLHILAARTGLFACYLFLIAFTFYQIIKIRQRMVTITVITVAVLLPVIAWFFFPTFQNRFKYLRYDFDFVKNSSYLPGATDGNRLFSMKAGLNILKENPLGVGAGDLRQETKEWYTKAVPNMVEEDKVYPSNEWLIHGGFAGWPGVILFSVAVLLPVLYKGIRYRFYWLCFHGTALFSFFVDTGLEVQFGIFLYLFITCCWWKSLKLQKE